MILKSRRWSSGWLAWVNGYLPVILWALVIFSFSAQPVLPSIEVSTLDFVFKKFAHMGVYAVLYILLVRAQYLTFPATKPSQVYRWPLLICFIYALTDELHQSITGGSRSPSARDVVYDMLGAGIILLRQYKYI